VDASPEAVWRAVCRVGGDRGWYSGERLWKLRGLIDRLAGGPGLRRGRRDPDRLGVGEPVDFWRVEDLESGRRLVLRAEMRLPGEAWLEWQIDPGPMGTLLVQTARFRPRGLLGRAYWLVVAPFHRLVFPGLVAGISGDAEAMPPRQPASRVTSTDRSSRPEMTASNAALERRFADAAPSAPPSPILRGL
jgi:hypothetical protein